jgi:hypothetical protein
LSFSSHRMPNSPRKIPLTTPPCFQKRETKLFHRYVVCSVISQTNGWMNPFWVSYPFSLLKKNPPSSSTTTLSWPRTYMNNSLNSPQRACSGILQYWPTCSPFFKQISSLSLCRKWTRMTSHSLSPLGLRCSEETPQEFNFKQFIEQFYHPVVSMLSGRPEPWINEEVQRILHLSDLAKTGDWYLYQNHTEIRVYGCEMAPYKLPKYFPVRIFALEYIRQMINSDEIHFVSLKKKQQLRIKGQIGPFICNSRAAGEEADKLLKDMNFSTSFIWHYDLCGIIAEMRLKNKSSPYAHTLKPEIEKFLNQTEWEVNTLEDIEQQSPLAMISQTTTPQVPKEKRPRKDVSPSVTEVSAEDFQVYTKRPKTTHTTHRSGEEETQSTKVVEGERSPLLSTSHQMMSTLPQRRKLLPL